MNGSKPLFRDQIPLPEATNLKVVDQLILPYHQGWDVRKINKLFEPTSARQIKGIELHTPLNVRAAHYWPFTKSGEYFTKSGYGVPTTK